MTSFSSSSSSLGGPALEALEHTDEALPLGPTEDWRRDPRLDIRVPGVTLRLLPDVCTYACDPNAAEILLGSSGSGVRDSFGALDCRRTSEFGPGVSDCLLRSGPSLSMGNGV